MTKKTLALIYNYDGSIPPLGIAYLSSYVKKYLPGWDTKIFCNRFEKDLEAAVIATKPSAVGFYTLTPGFNMRVRKPAARIKEALGVPLIGGGPHISTLPQKMPVEFDYGVCGEGERTTAEILALIDKGGKPSDEVLALMPSLVWRDSAGEIRVNPKRGPLEDLDSLPIPDYAQLNIRGYFPKRHREMPTKIFRGASVTTSRGCPFSCAFCQEAGEKSTYFSVERFIEEVRILVEDYGCNFIDVMDDLFIYNRKRLVEMRVALHKSGLHKKTKFFGYVRADHLTEGNVKELKLMGFESVFIGFESGSPKVLSFLKNKKSDGSENIRAMELCHKYDILVYGSFIFGSPGETMEDVKMTFDFIKKYPMALIEWQILTPLPGTEVWNVAVQKGIIDPANIDYDNLLLRDTFDPKKPWMSERMTKAEFDVFYRDVMKPVFWAYSQRANHFAWKDLLNPALWSLVWREPRFYASILKQTVQFKLEHGWIDVPTKVPELQADPVPSLAH